ncbi:hypothetical protein GYMLUDRAFT_170451, partial [Collybiopsis luxurians FD-317 M1]
MTHPHCSESAEPSVRPVKLISESKDVSDDRCSRQSVVSSCDSQSNFPPDPITQSHINDVIRRFAAACHPSNFEEGGCSVCGQLCLLSSLSPLGNIRNMLSVLEVDGVTRLPCSSVTEPVREQMGPVLDTTCNDMVCTPCRSSIRQGKVPCYALCNGLWLGNVPPELQGLTFYERLLVSRVQHSKCFVRVQRGKVKGEHSKLVANVVAYENPTPKIYN